MLKFAFWSLLCINGVLFAYSQGLLGHIAGNEREPARMHNQLNPAKLRLVPAPVAGAAALAEPPPTTPVPVPVPLTVCIEVGNFGPAEARRFEARLAPLALGERLSRQTVVPATEATSHIVYIPPQGSKEGAERKAGELKNLGVTSYFIMSDNSAMKWGISLGVFKSEAAAQALLASLAKQGVHSARLAARGAQDGKQAFRFRAIDAATRASIADIGAAFPALATRDCK
ncbi:MAG: SPOR domain-containing protein [Pseudomonadota bacterium]|nr:SPOR domain-containing protein [Pseudomonadota bacterium]